jgi:hypothetical protein
MVDIESLLKNCNPAIDLNKIESQYLDFINRLKLYKEKSIKNKPTIYRSSGETFLNPDVADYIQSRLYNKDFVDLTPLEVLSKIHKTVKYPIGYREVSRDIHYLEGDEIKSFNIKSALDLNKENIYNSYTSAFNRFIKENSELIDKIVATSADVIALNRRLIEKNIRCVRCNAKTLRCFKYDWINKKVI